MASLDMSLDDMIKNSRKNNRRGGRSQGQGQSQRQGQTQSQGRPPRGRGQGGPSRGGRPFGAPRRNPLGVNARPSASTIAKSVRRTRRTFWQNDLFEDSLKAAGLSAIETGTKLYVSNLDVGVTNDDIRELFSEFGELIRYAIHYDRNGRPSGSAELIFARRSDAFQALKRYNNVQLDGKPMKIEIIGANSEIPLSARVNVVGGANGKRRTVVMASGPGRSRGAFTAGGGFAAGNRGFVPRGRGGSNTGRGGGRGRGRGGPGGRGGAGGRGGLGETQQRWRKKNVEKSADDLDKELESYHAEAMQT